MEQFIWTDFYSEFASELLKYKDNRKSLIVKIKDIYINADIKLPTLDRNNNIVDIDPFTIFGLFNKGITNENRIKILTEIKKSFNIKVKVPQSFDGIPVVDNRSATFYYFSDQRGVNDIDNLWNLFVSAIRYSEDSTKRTEFIKNFDIAISQKGVSWNITMGLYWIRPFTYINLDSRNRKLLENNHNRFDSKIDILKLLKKMVSAEDYLRLQQVVKETLIEYENFPELSFDAWKKSIEDKDGFFGESGEYWPSHAEFDPNLSVEDWKKYLIEIEIPKHPSPMKMLKGMMELGGEASCKQLSKHFGGHPSVYVGCTSNLGRRVKNYFNLAPCFDGEQERFFPFPFYGKPINDDGHSYIYKIRPNLYKALTELDLSSFTP